MRSGIILAGGRSARFGGGEKSLSSVGGRPMICRVRDAIAPVVDEVVVSVRDSRQRDLVYPLLRDGCHAFACDELRDIGPLAGVLQSLKAARGEYAFVAACDMPFVSTAVVEMLFDKARGHDAAVPVMEDGMLQPLHAVYRREPMIRAVEESVGRGERRIVSPLGRLKDVAYVPAAEIRKIDPELKTLANINSAEDLSG